MEGIAPRKRKSKFDDVPNEFTSIPDNPFLVHTQQRTVDTMMLSQTECKASLPSYINAPSNALPPMHSEVTAKKLATIVNGMIFIPATEPSFIKRLDDALQRNFEYIIRYCGLWNIGIHG